MAMMLTTKDISALLDVSENSVRSWILEGKLNAGWEEGARKKYRVSVEELRRFAMTKPIYAKRFAEIESDIIDVSKGNSTSEEYKRRFVRVCPYCGFDNCSKSTVTSNKKSVDGYLVRYRKCNKCSVTYKTYEINDKEFEKYKRLAAGVQRLVDVYEGGM